MSQLECRTILCVDLVLTSFGIEGSAQGLDDTPLPDAWRMVDKPHATSIREMLRSITETLHSRSYIGAHVLHHASHGIHHSEQRGFDVPSPFLRMPPVSMNRGGVGFQPEYELLLLYDRIIIDEASWSLLERFKEGPYSEVARTLALLEKEGYALVVNFEDIHREEQDRIETQTRKDLRGLSQWLEPLVDAQERWEQFVSSNMDELIALSEQREGEGGFTARLYRLFAEERGNGGLGWNDPSQGTRLRQVLKRRQREWSREQKQAVRAVLAGYLSHVNVNLALCSRFGAGLHDWNDFLPFYEKKMARSSPSNTTNAKEQAALRKLFTVAFPQFRHWTPESLLKAVTDPRIESLRSLVSASVRDGVEFDAEFARDALFEVRAIEREVVK